MIAITSRYVFRAISATLLLACALPVFATPAGLVITNKTHLESNAYTGRTKRDGTLVYHASPYATAPNATNTVAWSGVIMACGRNVTLCNAQIYLGTQGGQAVGDSLLLGNVTLNLDNGDISVDSAPGGQVNGSSLTNSGYRVTFSNAAATICKLGDTGC